MISSLRGDPAEGGATKQSQHDEIATPLLHSCRMQEGGARNDAVRDYEIACNDEARAVAHNDGEEV